MANPSSRPDCSCARLRQRIALSVMVDELAIAALSDAVAVLRGMNDAAVPELEHAIRTHRIGIVKHRAILGAGGIDV